MCGICGIVSYDGLPDLALLRRMMGRLVHRGPDGNGYYRDRCAALGHTRLAIIDTSGGAQPLCNEDGTVWVTFNGEIFNYVELGAELRYRGHVFRTASDTEVIVHAWEEWGQECFSRFNGQWAIALWDRRAKRLVLSRDRLGVRPLFFTRLPTRLLFASEVKSIFADPSVERAFDPAGLGQTFTYWSPVAPRTVFRGIEQLELGSSTGMSSISPTRCRRGTNCSVLRRNISSSVPSPTSCRTKSCTARSSPTRHRTPRVSSRRTAPPGSRHSWPSERPRRLGCSSHHSWPDCWQSASARAERT